jgi:3-oxoadipate enol-lactonase
MRASPLWSESIGTGDPVVLVHAGAVAPDSRMWDDQVGPFSAKYRVIRFDAQGFGRSPASADPSPRADDIYELLRALEIPKAHFVAASFGGAAALDFVVTHPAMVGALVLIGPGLSGYKAPDAALVEWLDGLESEQEKALAAGDLDRAVQLDLEIWLAGYQRGLDRVDPALVDRVRPIAREGLQRQAERTRAPAIDPPAIRALDDIRAPTLIIVGDHEPPLVHDIAETLHSRIPASRKWLFGNTAHMPMLEHPAEFNRIVLEFLAIHPLGR